MGCCGCEHSDLRDPFRSRRMFNNLNAEAQF